MKSAKASSTTNVVAGCRAASAQSASAVQRPARGIVRLAEHHDARRPRKLALPTLASRGQTARSPRASASRPRGRPPAPPRVVDVRGHGNDGPGERTGPAPRQRRISVEPLPTTICSRGHAGAAGRGTSTSSAAVGIGIVDEPVDAPRQHGPQTLGRAQRIDAGAEIEDLVPIQPGPLGQLAQVSTVSRRHRSPHHVANGPTASVKAGTTSMISQTAPKVSPVAPPILR